MEDKSAANIQTNGVIPFCPTKPSSILVFLSFRNFSSRAIQLFIFSQAGWFLHGHQQSLNGHLLNQMKMLPCNLVPLVTWAINNLADLHSLCSHGF